MADSNPQTPTTLKSTLQQALKKKSSAALSVGSDGSASSVNSKVSLNHAYTFNSNDDYHRKHRDVGEVVAGIFSRKKKGKKNADENDQDDDSFGPRGASRDGAGSEGSSMMAYEADEDGNFSNSTHGINPSASDINFSVNSHVQEKSSESLPEVAGAIRRATSPLLTKTGRPKTPTKNQPSSLSNSNSTSSKSNEDSSTRVIPSSGAGSGSPSRSTTRSRRGGSISAELRLPPGTLGAAPSTTVTPPTPTSPNPRGTRGNRSSSLSNTPSKLSQSMTPFSEAKIADPGAPMAGSEDGRTSTVTNITAGNGANEKTSANQDGTGPGGFFQSMFNAAQNAATTLSNTVTSNMVKGESRNNSGANTPDVGRSRSGTETEEKPKGFGEDQGSNESGADLAQADGIKEEQPRKRLAVETLGFGELSLGSLGIHPSPSKTDLSKLSGAGVASSANTPGAGENSIESDSYKASQGKFANGGLRDDGLRSSAGGQLQMENTPADFQKPPANILLPPKTPLAEDATFGVPTGYISPGHDATTPNAEEDREEWISDTAGEGIKRSGSSRSNRGPGPLGHVRRHRNSSAATPASPAGSQAGPKITGFAVASKKRNRDFHALFRSVPEDDYLIEDYGCALQKDILLHGRLYVSEGHICFNSNIFGWVNTLVISFDEVMAIEKKSTALLFPNAIVIQTLHARNVFASFISRDTAYDLLVNIWKISHPGLIPSVTGFTLEKQPENKALVPVEGAGKEDGHTGSESEDEYDEDEEGYDEDDAVDAGAHREPDGATEDRVDGGYGELAGGGSSAPNGAAMTTLTSSKQQDTTASGAVGTAVGVVGGAAGAASDGKTQDFPGPVTHSATDCGDHELHYERQVCDEYLPGPLGKVYSLLFGPQSHDFLTRFLEDQKVLDLSIPNNAEWTTDVNGKKTRAYSYIRPLPGGIGPKQTKCICNEQLEQMDMEKSVSVLVTTQTPDVPSGNQFCVKTRYCLTWGDGSTTGSAAETHMVLNCTVEWSGKSWLKGPIEKGCNDGQITHGKDLTAALKRELEKSATALASKGRKGAKGGKGKKGGAKGGGPAVSAAQTAAAQKAAKEKEAKEKEERERAAWGILLPLKPFLQPLIETVPGGALGLLSAIGLFLLALCAATGNLPFVGRGQANNAKWGIGRRDGAFTPRPGASRGHYPSWEQSWYAEEQDRVGLNAASMGGDRRSKSWDKLSKFEKNRMQSAIGSAGGMGEREIEEAVEVMERSERKKKTEMAGKSSQPQTDDTV
ncbi:hypothetical protein BDZ91DRAFT_709138 [Kalaharituber pfeilii]|nr:hypothetical protein BDZ91DRAFT_709138 [Kalaharituber pfeilii]